MLLSLFSIESMNRILKSVFTQFRAAMYRIVVCPMSLSILEEHDRGKTMEVFISN